MNPFKYLLIPAITTLLLGTTYADPQRTLFSFENSFPRWEQFEVGAGYQYAENETGFSDTEFSAASIYARYGILDNLAARVDIPYLNIDPSTGTSESGLGDVEIGFQLRTYEDIFGYPYFIPHVSFTLPTGDEEKGLGTDGTIVTGGMTWGTQMYDMLAFILDVSYRIDSDNENQLLLSNSYVYEVSDSFALLSEIRFEEETDTVDSLVLVTGGMSYDWSKSLQMGLHVGTALTGEVDTLFDARLSYSF